MEEDAVFRERFCRWISYYELDSVSAEQILRKILAAIFPDSAEKRERKEELR